MIRVLFLKSGAPHQSKAPSLEFRGDIRVLILKNPGRPISPRLHPRSSGVIRVLSLQSGAPHQSKAPSLEFRGDIRVVILKSGAPHQSKAPSSEFRGAKS